MNIRDFYRALDVMHTQGITWEVVDAGDGFRTVRFDVDKESELSKKLLTQCTDEEIMAFADEQGYTLTQDDIGVLRVNPVPSLGETETLGEAFDDFISSNEC